MKFSGVKAREARLPCMYDAIDAGGKTITRTHAIRSTALSADKLDLAWLGGFA